MSAHQVAGPAPWETDPRPWLARLIAARFLAFIPLIGLLLLAAEQERIARPSSLFVWVLGYAGLNLILFLAQRRLPGQEAGRHGGLAGPLLLLSLAADCVVILALTHFTGGAAGPLTAFLLLPLLTAVLLVSRRAALFLCTAATAGLLALPAAAPDQATALERPAAGEPPAGIPALEGGAVSTGVAVLLWSVMLGALWYRRRGLFVEQRLGLLEDERAALSSRTIAAETAASRSGSTASAVRVEGRGNGAAFESVAAALAGDLREPTGVVRARAENLRYQLKEKREFRGLLPDLERVLRAAARLDDARLTLAALAHIDAVPPAATSVAQVADEVGDTLSREFERDGLRLRIDVSPRLPAVACSHNEIRLVLMRLLDSARRAALAAGRSSRIEVRFSRQYDEVILSVADPFPVPVEGEEWLLPDYSPRERPALGLALAVVQALAERRGGWVEAERRARGGLLVRVGFPVAERPSAVREPAIDAAPDPERTG